MVRGQIDYNSRASYNHPQLPWLDRTHLWRASSCKEIHQAVVDGCFIL